MKCTTRQQTDSRNSAHSSQDAYLCFQEASNLGGELYHSHAHQHVSGLTGSFYYASRDYFKTYVCHVTIVIFHTPEESSHGILLRAVDERDLPIEMLHT